MTAATPNRRRRFPFWFRVLVYAVLAYAALHVAGEAKRRRVQEHLDNVRAKKVADFEQE
jgi:hypothetical protein